MSTYGKELAVMKRAVAQASQLIRDYSAKGFVTRLKGDQTPVTEADVACEKAIRRTLSNAFPKYGILGEEEAEKGSAEGFDRRFIVDPIDGTRMFSRGILLCGPIIGLEVDGDVVAGAYSVVGFGETYWAEKGQGAFLNGQRIHVSKTARLRDAMGIAKQYLLGHLIPASPSKRFLNACKGKIELSQSYVFPLSLVASGRADAFVAPWMFPWDFSATKLVLEEAGGRLTNQRGESTIYGNSYLKTPRTYDWMIASNGKLHDEILTTVFPNSNLKRKTRR